MHFSYQLSDPEGRLSQGEILSDLQEPQPEHPENQLIADMPDFQFTLVDHPKIVILTPDCDLLTDFLARKDLDLSRKDKLLQHVQCCDVFEESEIRVLSDLKSDLWRRVKKNQVERYHRIPLQEVESSDTIQHPEFFLDFKKMFSISTDFLYKSLETGELKQQGVIHPIWLHSLIQRYFAFHSRIGVPDPEDKRR